MSLYVEVVYDVSNGFRVVMHCEKGGWLGVMSKLVVVVVEGEVTPRYIYFAFLNDFCNNYLVTPQGKIEKMERATFSKGHSSYLVSKLNWTPLPFEAKRPANVPSKRYLHTAITLQGKLYILGGIDNDADFKDHVMVDLFQKMYCLELATMKWTIIEGKKYCEGRNSHACAIFRNQIYFFGGSQYQSNPTNDFFKFSPVTGLWSLIESEEGVPAQRDLAIMQCINDQYLFLFGGIDILEDKIYDDAFIFRGDKWNRLNTIDLPSPRIRMPFALTASRIFAFGGQGPGEQSPTLFDNLYQVTIDQFELEMAFREIHPRGSRPQKRTAHAMVSLSSRFLLLYGGQGQVQPSSGNSVSGEILGDIWIYDAQQLSWCQIETLYGSLTPRYEFTMALNRNEIFIFGGMNQEHVVIDDLSKLEFIEDRHPPTQICQNCQQEIANRSSTLTNPNSLPSTVHSLPSTVHPLPSTVHPVPSTGFYYNLALEVSFPFRAVEIIGEVAQELGSDSITINSAKTVQQFDYLCFEFHGKKEISAASFLSLSYSNQTPSQATLLHLIKIGALGLGKTFLYIEASHSQRRVMLMSADSRFAPNFEDTPMHYSYVQDMMKGECYYGGSYGDKQTIYNILLSQVSDPYQLLSRREGNLLLIFQMNILPTVEKAYYYQLIFYNQPDCDIRIYHNEKKMELLETLGYNISTIPDFSCRTYLKYSKLRRKIKAFISNDDTAIHTENYLDYLRKQKNAGVIHELLFGKISNKLVQKCVIFECQEDKYLENNQGVLIYCGNQLIDRYDCKLGHVVSDKFYKKRYKKKENLFRYAGVLYLSTGLKLNLSKTRPVNKFKYAEILEELISKIKGARNEEEEEAEMGSLFTRFVFNRETTKRYKRENVA